MKNLVFLLCIFMCSCRPAAHNKVESIYNYPNSIVMNKSTFGVNHNLVELRQEKRDYTTRKKYYKLLKIYIPKYEYERIALGDTIK